MAEILPCKYRLVLIASIFIAFISSGCAAQKESARYSLSRKPTPPTKLLQTERNSATNHHRNPGDFKISVESGGVEVKDFNQPLVHHIYLSSEQIEEVVSEHQIILSSRKSKGDLGAKPQLDGQQQVMGVAITSSNLESMLAPIGLQRGDLITAIGRRHFRDFADLPGLFLELDDKGVATLTFERQGVPHKNFYYLAK